MVILVLLHWKGLTKDNVISLKELLYFVCMYYFYGTLIAFIVLQYNASLGVVRFAWIHPAWENYIGRVHGGSKLMAVTFLAKWC